MQPPAGQVAAALRLVSFDSCDDALAELKSAVAEHVTPYGLGGDDVTFDGGFAMAVPEAAAAGERGSLATGGADDSAGVTAPQEYSTPTPTRSASTSPTWSRPTAVASSR